MFLYFFSLQACKKPVKSLVQTISTKQLSLRGQNSVFVFNLGVHYSMSLNFTTYRDLVDSVIKLLKRNVDVQNNNKPIVIWKTTTFIEKEKTYPKNLTRWRFHTRQV